MLSIGDIGRIPYAAPICAAFLLALAVTCAATPLARRFAIRVGAVDEPGARRVNRVPIPRMGGLAVLAGILGSIALMSWGTHMAGWSLRLDVYHGSHIRPYWYVASLVIMSMVGAIDDKWHLTPMQKLAGQMVAASVATFAGLRLSEIVVPGVGLVSLGWLAYPMTIFFLLGYANMFNLIDGLDGLASGIAAISSATMFVVAALAGRMDAAAQAMILCGACLGFLFHNFHPASVFLGDSGALLIGFMMGSISLMSVSRVSGLTTIIVPLVVSGIPMMDTMSAIARRQRAGIGIGTADKGHLHHRLLEEGYDQRQAVLFIYAWTTMLCVGAVTMTQIDTAPRIAVFTILMGMSSLMAMQLQLLRPVLAHRDRDERQREYRARHMRRAPAEGDAGDGA